jgi:ABC-2 type transport system permease protein
MRDALRLYSRLVAVSMRAQMQYRSSFVMLTIGDFVTTGIEIIAIWALFDRFHYVQGWSFNEIALFYGSAGLAFAVADAFSAGFDKFSNLIKGGDFDRLLLRPRSTALQLAGQELTLRRIGRFSQAFLVFGYAVSVLDINWSAQQILLVLASIIGGSATFYAIIVLHATMTFWTTEGLEITNAAVYGGVETIRYPLDIYQDWFRKLFTFVIPLACVNYYPMLAVLGKIQPGNSTYILSWLSPIVGLMFLLLSLRVWLFGVRHYTSTGS